MKEMDEALTALHDATTRHAQAVTALEVARRDETAALNKLNEAQKRFDQVVTLVQASASAWGSEWSRKKHPGVPAT